MSTHVLFEVVVDENGNHWTDDEGFRSRRGELFEAAAKSHALESAERKSLMFPLGTIHVCCWYENDPIEPRLVAVYRAGFQLSDEDAKTYFESIEYDESYGWLPVEDDDSDYGEPPEPIGQEAFENSYIGGGGAPDYDNM